MRAFAVRGFGEAPALLDLPLPTWDATDFLIRVSCAGVNPVDYKRVDWLTAEAGFPYILGVDFAGVIEWAPPGDHGLRVGDRVFGMARRQGTYAEYTVASQFAPGEALARIPDDVSFEHAAVLPVAGVAAAGGLAHLGIAEGQTLAILGATGGVGGYALSLAVARGLRVIATVRGDGDEARRLGAHHVFDTSAGDVIAQIASVFPGGVDAVLDLVSDRNAITQTTRILRPGGRLVSALRVADEAWFQARGITAINLSGTENAKATRRGLEELAAALSDCTLQPRIALSCDLEQAAAALQRVRVGGLRGKAVLHVGA